MPAFTRSVSWRFSSWAQEPGDVVRQPARVQDSAPILVRGRVAAPPSSRGRGAPARSVVRPVAKARPVGLLLALQSAWKGKPVYLHFITSACARVDDDGGYEPGLVAPRVARTDPLSPPVPTA